MSDEPLIDEEDIIADYDTRVGAGEYSKAAQVVRDYPFLAEAKHSRDRQRFRVALTKNNAELVDAFLAAGVDPLGGGDIDGEEPFVFNTLGNPESLRVISAHLGANVPALAQCRDRDEYTLLYEAVRNYLGLYGQQNEVAHMRECMDLLLAAGADPDTIVPATQSSPLMLLCTVNLVPGHDDLEALRQTLTRMVAASHNLEQHTSFGYTLLHTAMRCQPFMFTEALLSHGADALALTPAGADAFNLAQMGSGTTVLYNENCGKLRKWIAERKHAAEQLATQAPEQVRKALFTPEGKATTELITLLGAGALAPLMSPEYWDRQKNPAEGITFAEEVKKALPEHLAHLGARADTITLQRGIAPSHEGSVLVEYTQGSKGKGVEP